MEFPLTYGLETASLALICTTDDLIFMLDTGANHSVLFTYTYEHLKETLKDLDGTREMMGMEGSKVAMNRVEGTINILGKYYTHVFSIFDGSKTFGAIQEKTGIQIHGILGLDFMVKYRWILDFERYVVIEKEEKEENVNS